LHKYIPWPATMAGSGKSRAKQIAEAIRKSK